MKRLQGNATRGEVIGMLTLLATIGYWLITGIRKDGAQEKEIERISAERSTLMAQRNRENDQMQERILSLEIALRNCRP